jgi:drug/metabolite transporter (DMT)-like permease
LFGGKTMNVEEMKCKNTKERVKLGYIMALLCAVLWGAWYIPGNLSFSLTPFTTLLAHLETMYDPNVAGLLLCVLITGINALFVVLALLFWCAGLGKFKEMKRSIVELKCCTKYYFLGAVFGGPMAIMGSYIAMYFIGAGFSAVAALCYPVIGVTLSIIWLKQKISKRALTGLFVILIGGIAIYSTSMINDLNSGTANPLGYVGGLMAILGWGIEGAVAAKGLDVSEPDVALTVRFLMECIIWWVITIPILLIAGVPILDGISGIFDPTTFLVLLMMGITFGLCYVTWYKSFPLIGVGRGQAIGSLYGLMAVVFLFIFCGTFEWIYVVGAIICIFGTFMLFTEKTDDMHSLRGECEK